MKRTEVIARFLQDRMSAFVKQHGSVTNAAKILDVDKSYVSRICSGSKINPSDSILKKLGLVRRVTYIDEKASISQ